MKSLSERMLGAMLHGLNDAVVTIDRDGRVTGFNHEACDLLGVAEGDALGEPVDRLLGLAEHDALLPPWDGGARDGELTVERDGTVRSLHATAARSADGGSVIILRAQGAQPKPVDTSSLPPRLKDTLAALLEGLSEKQIANKLGLSPHTVHDYVKALYKRFSVQSRGELLALFVAASHKSGKR